MIPDLQTMTPEEKLLTMRNLWEDMRQTIEGSAEPERIPILLNERIDRIKSGKAELLDWDTVKHSIGQQ